MSYPVSIIELIYGFDPLIIFHYLDSDWGGSFYHFNIIRYSNISDNLDHQYIKHFWKKSENQKNISKLVPCKTAVNFSWSDDLYYYFPLSWKKFIILTSGKLWYQKHVKKLNHKFTKMKDSAYLKLPSEEKWKYIKIQLPKDFRFINNQFSTLINYPSKGR